MNGRIERTPLFIAQFNIFQGKRLRMPVSDSFCTPFCIFIAYGIIYGIPDILYESRQFGSFHIITIVEHTGNAYISNIHGICSNIFTKLQKFMISKAVGGAVSPAIPLSAASHGITQSFLPLYPVFYGDALNNTASGPSHKCRFQVSKHLCNILA